MKENDYIIIINWQMRNMNVQFNISNKQELAQKYYYSKNISKIDHYPLSNETQWVHVIDVAF